LSLVPPEAPLSLSKGLSKGRRVEGSKGRRVRRQENQHRLSAPHSPIIEHSIASHPVAPSPSISVSRSGAGQSASPSTSPGSTNPAESSSPSARGVQPASAATPVQ